MENKGGEEASRDCPVCYSKRIWKDGKRKSENGSIQRHICRDCGYKFSEASVLSRRLDYCCRCQVGAVLTEAKNLTEVEPQKSGLAGATADIKGKIIQLAWHLKKEGRSESTITNYSRYLRLLVQHGANLHDPETIKEIPRSTKKMGDIHQDDGDQRIRRLRGL